MRRSTHHQRLALSAVVTLVLVTLTVSGCTTGGAPGTPQPGTPQPVSAYATGTAAPPALGTLKGDLSLSPRPVDRGGRQRRQRGQRQPRLVRVFDR